MIRISRSAKDGFSWRAYGIVIDGVNYGKIKRGETREFEVRNGQHLVSVGMYSLMDFGVGKRWISSKTLPVHVNDSSVVELEVGDATEELLKWFPALLKDDEFLSVREKGSESEMEPEPEKKQKERRAKTEQGVSGEGLFKG